MQSDQAPLKRHWRQSFNEGTSSTGSDETQPRKSNKSVQPCMSVEVALPEAEIERQAEQEGLTLVRSSRNSTGFKNIVHEGRGIFVVTCAKSNCDVCRAMRASGTILPWNSVQWVIGRARTAMECALIYARHVGPQQSRLEEAGEVPLSAAEVEALVQEEGLALVPSSRNAYGFRGVVKGQGTARKPYSAIAPPTVRQVPGETVGARPTLRKCLGIFATPEEAALAYARHLGPAASHAAAAERELLSPQEVEQLATDEGLTLVRSSNATGFLGVTRCNKLFSAHDPEARDLVLGKYASAEQAALALARRLGPDKSAAKASAHKGLAEKAGAQAKESTRTAAVKVEEREAAKAEKAAAREAAKAEKAAEREVAKQAKQAAKDVAKEVAKAELEQRRRLAAAHQQALLKEAAAAAATRRQQSATWEEADGEPSAGRQDAELQPRPALDDVAEVSIDRLIEMLLEPGALNVARTPSERLGLPLGAPRDACRKRYLALALRLHPDKTSHPRAAEAFNALEKVFCMCCDRGAAPQHL
jgi:hypothetical protein